MDVSERGKILEQAKAMAKAEQQPVARKKPPMSPEKKKKDKGQDDLGTINLIEALDQE